MINLHFLKDPDGKIQGPRLHHHKTPGLDFAIFILRYVKISSHQRCFYSAHFIMIWGVFPFNGTKDVTMGPHEENIITLLAHPLFPWFKSDYVHVGINGKGSLWNGHQFQMNGALLETILNTWRQHSFFQFCMLITWQEKELLSNTLLYNCFTSACVIYWHTYV